MKYYSLKTSKKNPLALAVDYLSYLSLSTLDSKRIFVMLINLGNNVYRNYC